ncbi:MAG: C39 family peptidase [Anaerolineae bacterium]|nr:C39 family peptidase [Anaerolineae bacterium]
MSNARPHKPHRSPGMRLRRTLHRWIDPVRSWPNGRRAARELGDLPDGAYRIGVDVPYVPQFASPDLIRAYIHDGLHGRDDPNWHTFGADDADTYTFWAHRACAIACVKMAVDAYGKTTPRPMWQWVEEGLSLGGYRVHDEAGNFVDIGWYHAALVQLAERYGLRVRGMGYASLPDVCLAIRDGWLVAAGVTPDLGERGPLRRYDGHFVLVYGFTWQAGRCVSVMLHNPSGRYPELQAGAVIPADRFRAAFAHRFIAFRGD